MSDTFLFDKEENVIKKGEALLQAWQDSDSPEQTKLCNEYQLLLKQYQKLFSQAKRLVRMNDRHEAELSKKTKELNLRNSFIKKAFGRYMSDEVVEKLLESPDGLALGGQTLPVTIMFTDLRGFSAISESLPSETVMHMLNDYLEVMNRIILKYSGAINEIMGDGLLIVFGAPNTRSDDADRAVACAIEMQQAMTLVNTSNREKKLPELDMGIGMNTGNVVVGNVGSDIRTKYAVLGNHVNLAARVESFAIGGQVLITRATQSALTVPLQIQDEFAVPFKGINKPVSILNIFGLGHPYNLHLPVPVIRYKLLQRPLLVNVEILDGKTCTGESVAGYIYELANKYARISIPLDLAKLSNLKLTFDKEMINDACIYAKVLKVNGTGYEVNFTFILPVLNTYLTALAEDGKERHE